MLSLVIFYSMDASSYYVHLYQTSQLVYFMYPFIMYPCPYFFFNYTLLPDTIKRPLDIMIIVSERHYAYYILCVVIRTVRFLRIFKINFHVRSLICASIPVVGSSSITSFGSPMRLIAKESLLLMPPENVDTFPFLFSYRFTESKHFLIYFQPQGKLFSLQNILTCSDAVSSSQRISN